MGTDRQLPIAPDHQYPLGERERVPKADFERERVA
jgi:hypothetical protein